MMTAEAASVVELAGQGTMQAAPEERDAEGLALDQLPEDTAIKQSGGALKGLLLQAQARTRLLMAAVRVRPRWWWPRLIHWSQPMRAASAPAESLAPTSPLDRVAGTGKPVPVAVQSIVLKSAWTVPRVR